MTEQDAYFFDTYAILEILGGNPNYKKYTDADIVVTKLNLFELFYKLLKESGEEKAQHYLDIYKPFAADFDENVISEAAKMEMLQGKLSMADCIGFIVAEKLGIKFLTGDSAFEAVPNVEFVK